MARKYVEEALTGVYDYLDANLNTELATLRTTYDSAYPANYGLMTKRPTKKRVFPKVTIYKDFTDHEYAYENQPLIEPWLFHNFMISVEHLSGSLEELDLTLMRYTRALNELQEADDTFGDAFVWVRFGREDWTPVFTNQERKESVQGVYIPIECRSI